jgi:hypothetical protein
MYVIATVFCSNFHFSVSLHVPFSQFLFERDSYSNEYLAKNKSLANAILDTAHLHPGFFQSLPAKQFETPAPEHERSKSRSWSLARGVSAARS